MDVKNIALGVAIFVLTLFVVIYGINTFFNKPEYSEFCRDSYYPKVTNDKLSCEASNDGVWVSSGVDENGKDLGYCDNSAYYRACQEEYDKANERFSRNVFLVVLPAAVLLIALGALLFALEPVGVGLMAGGIGSIIYGVGGYWQYSENWLRFVISLIGLIIVIFIAYFFNDRFGRKNRGR